MSKERKFHQLIEQQNQEEKNRVWQKICEKEAAIEAEEKPVLSVARFSWKKWTTVAATAAVALIFGVFAVVKFFPCDNVTPDDSQSNGEYFTEQMYDMVETTQTLKEYAAELQKDILFFDWYAETDHVKDFVWQLKDTKEIICFKEEIIDVNTGCRVYIFIVNNDTEIDAFSSYEGFRNLSEIEGITVQWRYDNDRAFLKFEYQNYKYYLRIDKPLNEEYVLTLVADLLPNA